MSKAGEPFTVSRTARLLATLAPADAANIMREALLLFLILLPLFVALVFRFLLPELEATLEARLAFDLAPYYPMIMGVFIAMSPTLIGAVYGLLLVDERDERTLIVLRVTPAPFSAYLMARLAVPTLLAVGVTILTYPLAGLSPLPVLSVIAIAVSGATIVPVAALTVAAFAPNKLAGLVIFRLVNTAAILPALAFMTGPGWDRLAWIVPSYWPMKALWLAIEGRPFWLELMIAPLMNLALAVLLYRWFDSSGE